MAAIDKLCFQGYITVLKDCSVCYLVVTAACTSALLMDGVAGMVSGFVCAHTLPVLYERYQDQVDDFLYNMLGVVQSQYRKLDTKGILKGGVSKFRKSD